MEGSEDGKENIQPTENSIVKERMNVGGQLAFSAPSFYEDKFNMESMDLYIRRRETWNAAGQTLSQGLSFFIWARRFGQIQILLLTWFPWALKTPLCLFRSWQCVSLSFMTQCQFGFVFLLEKCMQWLQSWYLGCDSHRADSTLLKSGCIFFLQKISRKKFSPHQNATLRHYCSRQKA